MDDKPSQLSRADTVEKAIERLRPYKQARRVILMIASSCIDSSAQSTRTPSYKPPFPVFPVNTLDAEPSQLSRADTVDAEPPTDGGQLLPMPMAVCS